MVHGWSGDAHRLIADIAASFILESAQKSLFEFTKTSNFYDFRDWMKEISTWADTDEATEFGFGESPKYHFVHTTSACERYDEARDCGDTEDPGVCLVTGIHKHIKAFVSPKTLPSQRLLSLQYLVHYLADIHQPMHVAFRDDRGGNQILDVSPYHEDLHNIWDNALVHASKDSSGTVSFFGSQGYSKELYESITFNLKKKIERDIDSIDLNNDADVKAFIAPLADETSSRITCPISYPLGGKAQVESGDSLDRKYIQRGSKAVASQITKAGVRLGKLLNAMFAQYEENRKIADLETQERMLMNQAEHEMKSLIHAEKSIERRKKREEELPEKERKRQETRERILEAKEIARMGDEDEFAKKLRTIENYRKLREDESARIAEMSRLETEKKEKLEARNIQRLMDRTARAEARAIRRNQKLE